jgi:hypothetical protein
VDLISGAVSVRHSGLTRIRSAGRTGGASGSI